MKLTDDFDENEEQTGLPVIFMAVGVMSFILLVVIVVFAVNRKPKRTAAQEPQQAQQMQSAQQATDDDLGIGQSTLTSDQLDFWDMYKDDGEPRHGSPQTVSSSSYEQKAQEIMEAEEVEKEPDPSEGGIKTKVILPDGSEQWVMINAYIAKHGYDFVGLVYLDPVMRYYENGTNISHLGIHLNKASGTVNFRQLKKSGVEYVIIRVGMRGYQNGQISIDEAFDTYVTEAQEAGLEVGLSFYSQAVSQEEAVEEANLLLGYIGENKITYPIVFDMELVSNDTSRVQLLSKLTLTGIADAFCRTIREAGYTPMIYGNKYWLLRRIDLTKLGDYDIWLSQEEEVPDYPYKFAMWEYTQKGQIQGVEGDAALSISFIDYTMR